MSRVRVDILDKGWWQEAIMWFITVLGFLFITAGIFYKVTGNWDFLKDFNYWLTLVTTTSIASLFRKLYQKKGERIALATKSVKEAEEGKNNLISLVMKNNLSDNLDVFAKKITKENKMIAYKNKCDYLFTTKKLFFNKRRTAKWKKQRELIVKYMNGTLEENEIFNINNVKVGHYKVTVGDLLSTSNVSFGKEKRRRYNANKKFLQSYQVTLFTMLGSAVMGGVNVFYQDFNKESLWIFLTQVFIFTLNIYSGLSLGNDGIKEDYMNDIVDDMALITKFLKLEEVFK